MVLSGGALAPDAFRKEAELHADSVRRCLHAAALYHQRQPCLVLASGGKPDPTVPGPPLAELMRALLIKLGVRPADVLVESASRTTFENAVESARLLAERHLRRAALVTDAAHLPRAVWCFRKQGIDVVPTGCHYCASEFRAEVTDFLPGLDGLAACQEAAHEWLGMAWYWVRGRI